MAVALAAQRHGLPSDPTNVSSQSAACTCTSSLNIFSERLQLYTNTAAVYIATYPAACFPKNNFTTDQKNVHRTARLNDGGFPMNNEM